MAVERLRGRAGQRQRLRRLKRTNGLCEHCQRAGRITEATVVNHKIPLDHGGSDDDDNTENLCSPCDRAETARQFNHQVAIGSRGVAADGRPTSPDHAWNRIEAGPALSVPASPPGGRKSPTPLGGHRSRGSCAAGGVPD